MTALSALRSTTVRRDISRATHAHDETVKAFLRGFPTGRDEDLRAAALAAGVDLGTIPVLPAEVIAKRKQQRAPKCKRCWEIEARAIEAEKRVAELEAQLDDKQDLARRTIDLARRYTKLRTFAAGMVQQLRDARKAGHRTVAAIDAQDAEARRPRSPAELVAALQDSPHRELGPSRPAIAIRREPKPRVPVVTIVMPDEPAVAT